MEELLELVILLDRSGSMSGLEEDTIRGFNHLIEQQNSGLVNVTAVLFDDKQEVVYDRCPIAAIHPLTETQYFVRGATALLDAIGTQIEQLSRQLSSKVQDQAPPKVLFAITTDGYENASTQYHFKQIQQLIAHHSEKGWEFVFIGANIDAVESAARLGIDRSKAVNYVPDSFGTAVCFEAIALATKELRSSKQISEQWKALADQDYMARSGVHHRR